ncbi:MAG TPA: 16S rRNA (uracil(1498)-N(3))-methyltransferase [Ferrovibrio sp.]|jgi:16S rRNA (uracil1498-N3)-methyltransferase|uniref:16S rRNA (uracil(1498)-N(3))-methyltransferase n=1 Tax=Ferrovibrio sp. TaxID=1917215 RepID=UPI002B4ADC0F|nr:16S rRNA (uracil(1498)-N(3))-methyltransferase [Ferrovibrio sp.]HLT78837.1 16S rRNA (uracil(1498)-N(3))-methyltransferase [Ferrovibrio sp.]
MTAIKARLFVPDSLSTGEDILLAAEQAHYLRHVLRLGEGDPVAVFNGRDGEYRATIAAAGKKECRLRVEAQLRAFRPAGDIWLCFAPIRQGRIEFIVEKATELGVGRLLPVLTRRTQVQKVNVERLSAHAREAAEQSERLDVPEIAAAVPLERLLAEWPAERRLFFCAERAAAAPLLQAAQELPADAPCAVMIGPEGGFAPEETALAQRHGAVMVSLGPGILRAETAAVAALAILQAARQN